MQKHNSFALVISIGIAALTLAAPANATLITTYTYSGDTYGYTGGVVRGSFGDIFTFGDSAFDSTMSISGSFSIDTTARIPGVSYGFTSTLQSYSFSDGVQTLTEANSTLNLFSLVFGASGDITDYRIRLGTSFPDFPIPGRSTRHEITLIDDALAQFHRAEIETCTRRARGGGCLISTRDIGDAQPGAWSSVTVEVPEPRTLLLFALGLVGLTLHKKRRCRT